MRRKLLIVLSVTIVLVAVVLLFFRPAQKRPTRLTASDIVAFNINFTDKLPQTKNSLAFFTGTAIADIKFPKNAGPLSSRSRSVDIPFTSVDKVDTDGKLTLVRAYYEETKNIIEFTNGNSRLTSDRSKAWFTANNEQVRPLHVGGSTTITDAVVGDGRIYALVSHGEGNQRLLIIDNDRSEELVSGLTATSFVGVLRGRIIMRDLAGKVFLYDQRKVTEIFDNAGEVYLDKPTNNLIISPIRQEEISEEGGAIVDAKGEDQRTEKITLIHLDTLQKEEKTLPSSIFFVSEGYLITIPSLIRPTSLNFINLKNEEEFSLPVDQSRNQVSTPLRSLHIIQDNIGLVGAVTTSNQLLLFGEESYVENLEPAKLPIVKTAIGDYGYEYNVRSSSLTIYYDRLRDDMISDSLDLFEAQCDCDVNQLYKRWQAIATEPGA